jgi:hypothetical protein
VVLLPTPRDTEPRSTCPTCARGCNCPIDGPGCEHYGCWGRWPTRSCPGVTAEEARYEAMLADKRAAEARVLNRRTAHLALLRSAGLGTITP